MSDYDPHALGDKTSDWPTVVDGPMPQLPHRTPAELCGRVAGPVAIAANQNVPTRQDAPFAPNGLVPADMRLFGQLPPVIQLAIDEWAVKLSAQPWRFRREVMSHFAKVFADQFEANIPDMTADAYEGLKEIGFTCLLERLDDGRPVADLHQARIYLDSVHDHHRFAAESFLGQTAPRELRAH